MCRIKASTPGRTIRPFGGSPVPRDHGDIQSVNVQSGEPGREPAGNRMARTLTKAMATRRHDCLMVISCHSLLDCWTCCVLLGAARSSRRSVRRHCLAPVTRTDGVAIANASPTPAPGSTSRRRPMPVTPAHKTRSGRRGLRRCAKPATTPSSARQLIRYARISNRSAGCLC